MGRKNLGGESSLRADSRNKDYNGTLEHVYETAVANLDDKHKKKRQKCRVPNFLSLCMVSAVDDVIDTSFDKHRDAEEVLSLSTLPLYPFGEDDDAVFLMKDVGVGQSSHNRSPRGKVRNTMIRVVQSMKDKRRPSVYDL